MAGKEDNDTIEAWNRSKSRPGSYQRGHNTDEQWYRLRYKPKNPCADGSDPSEETYSKVKLELGPEGHEDTKRGVRALTRSNDMPAKTWVCSGNRPSSYQRGHNTDPEQWYQA